MSKAEKFIQENTRNDSNVVAYSGMFEIINFRHHEWLTPDQARRAVEIAKEEILEKVVKWINDNFYLYEGISGYYVAKELKQAMKDE